MQNGVAQGSVAQMERSAGLPDLTESRKASEVRAVYRRFASREVMAPGNMSPANAPRFKSGAKARAVQTLTRIPRNVQDR